MTEPKGFMSDEGYAEHLNRRLAQAERERDEWKAKWEIGFTESLAERDAAKAEEATWRERWVKHVAEMQRQRDAALAEVAKLRGSSTQYYVPRGEYDAALAKAEAADRFKASFEQERRWHLDLCARIEALADEWDVPSPNGRYYSALLRALLQPAKEESALDLVDALIKANSLTNGGDRHLAAELFKLRKLLEEKK